MKHLPNLLSSLETFKNWSTEFEIAITVTRRVTHLEITRENPSGALGKMFQRYAL